MSSSIRTLRHDDGLYQVTFDKPGSTANVFDQKTMQELGEIVDRIAADGTAKGVLFDSAKPSIFVAGADISEFDENLGEDEIRTLVRRGQRVFSKIAALDIPTFAAIHGAALGGGCELALACDQRFASDDRSTKIGLPEVMLGILPAWGGTTRLPRLLGLPSALGMILAGKTWPARKAQKAGLVDRIVPREHMLRIARESLGKEAPRRKGHRLTNNRLAASLIARKARSGVLSKTGGHYPAPLAALDVAVRGLSLDIERSLELEVEAILDLVRGPVSRNLVRVFMLQERAKRLRIEEGIEPTSPRWIAVIGAGVMGAGIVQWSAARGHQVVMQDINEQAVAAGLALTNKLTRNAEKRRIFTRVEAQRVRDRIHPTSRTDGLQMADLVVEAAAEKLEVKHAIFESLESRTRSDAILATNTSSLSIDAIAARMQHPERFLGLHFFNPVHKMQLVEVVVGARTSKRVLHDAVSWVQKIGKLPVVVKDSPGFLVNRILLPYLIEAGLLFSEGAPIEDLDRAMKSFGMPMGPMRLIDEVGLDVAQHAAAGMESIFDGRIPQPAIIYTMVERGFLGRKSGAGFYTYEDGSSGKEVHREAADFVKDGPARHLDAETLSTRMVLPMINEAARCLEEGLVEAPEDVDLAMVMGTGFAPFRGGPLRWADSLSLAEVVSQMQRLAKEVDQRFAPCALISEMAGKKLSFYDRGGNAVTKEESHEHS